jgi:hypothetical protein
VEIPLAHVDGVPLRGLQFVALVVVALAQFFDFLFQSVAFALQFFVALVEVPRRLLGPLEVLPRVLELRAAGD